ncbi:aminoacyl-tRNA hydrolase [Gryllotalpicola sp.]|uniref:aminoacyl-tRNA hydrolase n=1 Tax=Gryllotalpicola sp. TaxID=1932787 RepID=UPI00261ED34B|nr:aminoacyl-tRNA hydrolase [Gryllotalpicola sp.]
MAADTWLVVGLGNPGAQYANTRHNVGQLVVDELARRAGAAFTSHKANAHIAEGRAAPGAPKLVLAKSNGYMNSSGGPVSALLRFFSLTPAQLIVVQDELDIPFDSLKLKFGGGHGGHNGIRDIMSAVGTGDFIRVRVGVGRPPGERDAADHVLRPFTAAERKNLPILVGDAADAVELITQKGLAEAQLKYHTG